MSGVATLRGRARKAPITTWITAQKVSDISMLSGSETIPLSHNGSAKPTARVPGRRSVERKEHCLCQPGQSTSRPWAPAEGNELMISYS